MSIACKSFIELVQIRVDQKSRKSNLIKIFESLLSIFFGHIKKKFKRVLTLANNNSILRFLVVCSLIVISYFQIKQ
jgi:hypothetical protein